MIFFFNILNGYNCLKGKMWTKEWQDDFARCIQCENEGGGGSDDCCMSTKVEVAVVARKRRETVIGCKSLP